MRVDQLAREHVHELQVEGPLGLEVLVDQRLGHPGRLGDVVHGGGGVAVLGEEGEGDVEELAAPGVGGEAAPPWGCGAGSAGSGSAVGLDLAVTAPIGGHGSRGSVAVPGSVPGSHRGRAGRRRSGRAGRRREKWASATARLVQQAGIRVRPARRRAGRSRRGRTSRSRRRPARRPPDRARWPAAAGGRPTRWSGCRTPPRWRGGRPRRRPGRRRRPPSPVAPSGGPRTTGHRAAGHQGVELRAVPVLGRAEQPVGGAQLGGHLPCRRPRSCGGWPGWAGAPAGRSSPTPRARRTWARRSSSAPRIVAGPGSATGLMAKAL